MSKQGAKKYDISQICILFRLNKNTTDTLISKYIYEESKTLNQWRKILGDSNINIENK